MFTTYYYEIFAHTDTLKTLIYHILKLRYIFYQA